MRNSILSISVGKKWNISEVNILKKFYPNTENRELFKMFGGRTYDSVIVKAKKLGLKKNKEFTKKIKSKNMSGEKNPMYGKLSTKKGLTYEEFYGTKRGVEIKKEISKKTKGRKGLIGIENPMYGKTPWNKNRKLTENEKIKQSKAAKKYWNSLSDEDLKLRKDQLSKEWVIKRDKYKEIDTIPEKHVEKILIEEKIKYKKKKNIGYYNCDFVVENTIIEVQGDYWHGNPKLYNLENFDKIQLKNHYRDIRKKKYLTDKGYVLLYLWEFDIKNNIEKIRKLLKNEITGFKK